VIKEVFAPHLNRNVKFGRRRPVAPAPRMRFARYLTDAIPAPPAAVDFSAKAAAVLAMIYLNDQLGDCVIAGGYHIVGVETGNATGTPYIASDAVLKADYSAIGGYVDGDPSTDNGCDEDTAIHYWTNHGFANGTKLLGSLSVDATNAVQVKQAVWLTEEIIICMELPDAYVNPFPGGNGFVWDVAGDPVPKNGHSIMACGYTDKGLIICTWGMLGILTWAALAKYAVTSAGGSLNAVLTPDQLAKGQVAAPNGVSWNSIIADFDALGGNVPIPAPPPPAPPAPPSSSVSLAQAETAVKAALLHQPWLISRGSAVATAMKALESLKGWPT
jgi:hypothetical protein